MMKKGFPIIANHNTKVLVMGTFPGEIALSKNEYYGNPRNGFWKTMSSICNTDIANSNYQTKLKVLLDNKIGLWDIIDSCNRDGSLDTSIKDKSHNDFSLIRQSGPNIEYIFFNGHNAASKKKDLEKFGYKTLVLPSLSPTNARIALSDKTIIWKDAFSKVNI